MLLESSLVSTVMGLNSVIMFSSTPSRYYKPIMESRFIMYRIGCVAIDSDWSLI